MISMKIINTILLVLFSLVLNAQVIIQPLDICAGKYFKPIVTFCDADSSKEYKINLLVRYSYYGSYQFVGETFLAGEGYTEIIAQVTELSDPAISFQSAPMQFENVAWCTTSTGEPVRNELPLLYYADLLGRKYSERPNGYYIEVRGADGIRTARQVFTF